MLVSFEPRLGIWLRMAPVTVNVVREEAKVLHEGREFDEEKKEQL